MATHVFTIVDQFTHWPGAIPLTDQGFTQWLGGPLRGPNTHDLRPRGAVHLTALEALNQPLGDRSQAHHGIPSPDQWIGRMVALALKGFLEGSPGWSQLDERASLGVARHQYSTQGGQRCCSMELVYGSTIMVSGDFVGNLAPGLHSGPTASKPRGQNARPQTHSRIPTQGDQGISATHVFIRHSAHHAATIKWPEQGPHTRW